MEILIVENGGRIGTLDDPKLTHILLDKRDISRRKELSAQTSKSVATLVRVVSAILTPCRPKRRYLVLADFIPGCIAENTLLDEPGEGYHYYFARAFLTRIIDSICSLMS
jgi:DNA ligase 4